MQLLFSKNLKAMAKSIDKYKALTRDITKYLKGRNVYDKVDTTLIQMLVDSMEAYDMAWDDIRERGLQVNIRKSADDEPYLQLNQSFAAQATSSKMITAISTKLGLTVLDRTKLKLTDAKKADPLDDII